MCGEHQLLQHPASTQGTHVFVFLLQRSFQPPPPFRLASALLTKKIALGLVTGGFCRTQGGGGAGLCGWGHRLACSEGRSVLRLWVQ